MTKGFAKIFIALAVVVGGWGLLSAQEETGYGGMTGSAPFDELRKNRPPRPTGEASHDQFPSDFLTISTPAPEVQEAESVKAADPSSGERKKADSGIMIAVFVALGLFGLFTWSDYRYRSGLEAILVRNRRLIDGEAFDDDFDLPRAAAFVGAGGFSSPLSADLNERRYRLASDNDSFQGAADR